MDITYLGHSCFRIRGREASIVTDPFSSKYGMPLGRPNASIVTLSGRHGGDIADHTNVGGVAGDPRVVDGPGEYEIANVLINGVRTARRLGRRAGHVAEPEPEATDADGEGDDVPKAVDTSAYDYQLNTAYVMAIDDIRICHLGDLAGKLTTEQIEEMGSINVLMVPIGGGEATIGPNQAVEVVSQIEPNIVIPMHYRIEGTKSDKLEPLDRFIREMGVKAADPAPKLTVNSKSGFAAEMQLMVLDHRRGSAEK
jgi:L-ascorbate metabolism protein UlaG (beta-lactamase superfamily)